MKNKKILILGAGWYGCHIGLILKEKGYKTVPQIFDGELHIGGYTELRTFLTK